MGCEDKGYCESSKGQKGDCGIESVPRCCLLMLFQEGTPEIVSSGKNLNSANKVTNWNIVDFLKYLY